MRLGESELSKVWNWVGADGFAVSLAGQDTSSLLILSDLGVAVCPGQIRPSFLIYDKPA